jgi:hypothetical protein
MSTQNNPKRKIQYAGTKPKPTRLRIRWQEGRSSQTKLRCFPPGAESDARTVNTDPDKAIAKNVDAALIQDSSERRSLGRQEWCCDFEG